jgi:hypothetical protein
MNWRRILAATFVRNTSLGAQKVQEIAHFSERRFCLQNEFSHRFSGSFQGPGQISFASRL